MKALLPANVKEMVDHPEQANEKPVDGAPTWAPSNRPTQEPQPGLTSTNPYFRQTFDLLKDEPAGSREAQAQYHTAETGCIKTF